MKVKKLIRLFIVSRIFCCYTKRKSTCCIRIDYSTYSNLMLIPTSTLTGLLTVYTSFWPDGLDNEPEPIPLFSIILVANVRIKLDGKFISMVFIVPVVAVLKKMSYVVLVFTILFEGIMVMLVSVPRCL